MEKNNLYNPEKDTIYKKHENDTVFWVRHTEGAYGRHVITFDKENFINLFTDYPQKLTPEQKEAFDRENPYWAEILNEGPEE